MIESEWLNPGRIHAFTKVVLKYKEEDKKKEKIRKALRRFGGIKRGTKISSAGENLMTLIKELHKY